MPTGTDYKATDEQRGKVWRMSSMGISQEDIAKVLGICKKTLIKHYRRELDVAALEANTNVGGALYTKAMDGDTASMIFWLKTRARWRETNHIQMDIRSADDLTDEQLAQIAAATDE